MPAMAPSPRPPAATPSPAQPHPQPQPQAQSPATGAASRWPLFAGIGVAALGLAAAGGVLLSRGGSEPAPAPSLAPAPPSTPVSTSVSTPAPGPSGAAAVAIAEPPAQPGSPPGPPFDPDQEAALVPNPADMEFPDSSTRLLTAADVAGKGPTTLRVARNEIYARKGRKFQDPWLREWFGRYAWYRPIHDLVPLNAIERQNVELLQRAEQPYR
jgi:hypothetical protein